MAKKDWEYYKNRYIESRTRSMHTWLNYIEREFKSPIERIAYLEIMRLCDTFCMEDQPSVWVTSQAKIGKYVADFLVRCKAEDGSIVSIVVECDGHDFHEKTKEQVAHDKKRDRYMTTQGYKILRYSGKEICDDPSQVRNDLWGFVYEALGIAN